jgi:ABC-type uncharacterized transport system substrate-binding protein
VAGVAALAAPPAPRAQRVPRIGWLTNSVVHSANVEAFRSGMRVLGYAELRLEIRAADGRVERLPELAADLIARNVDIIVTDGGPAATAAGRATTTIPIVIGAATSEFLMRERLVGSLARPGRNITGFTISTGPELYGKRIELLREAVGRLLLVVVVWNPRNEGARSSLRAIEGATSAVGAQFQPLEAADVHQLERGLGELPRKDGAAMLTVADAFLWSQRALIVSLATKRRLPGMYPEPEFALAGGLMAYGTNVPDNFRRAAGHVDKILRGASPGDIPVEQPTRFQLVVNLTTARALGLSLPPSLLARADHVVGQ